MLPWATLEAPEYAAEMAELPRRQQRRWQVLAAEFPVNETGDQLVRGTQRYLGRRRPQRRVHTYRSAKGIRPPAAMCYLHVGCARGEQRRAHVPQLIRRAADDAIRVCGGVALGGPGCRAEGPNCCPGRPRRRGPARRWRTVTKAAAAMSDTVMSWPVWRLQTESNLAPWHRPPQHLGDHRCSLPVASRIEQDLEGRQWQHGDPSAADDDSVHMVQVRGGDYHIAR
jgi:hypothetical protein